MKSKEKIYEAWNDYKVLCSGIAFNHTEVMYHKNGKPNTQLEQEEKERDFRVRYFQAVVDSYSLSEEEISDLRLLTRDTKYDF